MHTGNTFLYIFIKRVADGMIALKIIGLVFTILIVINFVSAIPAITNRYFSEKTVGSDDAITAFKFEDTKPNVYYFIYDEYGGYENLQRYYDYDNGSFYDDLKAAGVNVSYSSRNTAFCKHPYSVRLPYKHPIYINDCTESYEFILCSK